MNRIFVRLTKKGADRRMSGGVVGALYEVDFATRTAGGNGLSVEVIKQRHRYTTDRCILGPDGDYEFLHTQDQKAVEKLAISLEQEFLDNLYADQDMRAAWEDDRNPLEFYNDPYAD